jgi:hypothetical protein
MVLLQPVRGVDEPEVVRGLDIGEGDILPFKCCGDLECKRGLPMGETGHDMFLGIWISLLVRKIKSDKKLSVIIANCYYCCCCYYYYYYCDYYNYNDYYHDHHYNVREQERERPGMGTSF